jgi:hypothetical protein
MPFQYKKILSWVILSIIILGVGVWVFYRLSAEKKLQLTSPNGNEKWQAGKTYKITWKAKNIGKLAIVLIKGEDSKTAEWIAKDIPARKKKYDFQIFVWEEPRQDYKISIFEYPWKEGNKIDYSDEKFTILGPQFASCDKLSIEAEWPYIPSDFPDQRKVFITETSFTGNLEGLAGADKKCQAEAEAGGLTGTWKAFLGDEQTLAMDRLKLEGIFVEARPVATLPEGKTCHRLLGKDFNEFFKKLSDSLILNKEKLEENFLNDLSRIWLGRINAESKTDCITTFVREQPQDPQDLPQSYSFTTTCQNWTTGEGTVPDYPPQPGQKVKFPKCYTPQGIRIEAVGLAGLSSGLLDPKGAEKLTTSLGKYCNILQKLLCIEQ